MKIRWGKIICEKVHYLFQSSNKKDFISRDNTHGIVCPALRMTGTGGYVIEKSRNGNEESVRVQS